MHLRVPPLPRDPTSIDWHHGVSWQLFPHLPRDAFSGPVQHDKAEARDALMRLVQEQRLPSQSIDIRKIHGMACDSATIGAFNSLEGYVNALPKRRVRIISYNDFRKALAMALPNYAEGRPLSVFDANWRGHRLYLDNVQDPEALAHAIVYARQRGLEEQLTARVIRYQVTDKSLNNLAAHYHFLGMADHCWSDHRLLTLLVRSRLPYARLKPAKIGSSLEYLLLPRNNALARAFGNGLVLAGAQDLSKHLKSWLKLANR